MAAAEDEEQPPQRPPSSHHHRRLIRHQLLALALTFTAYASFHAARKPPSIVKSLLSRAWPPFSGPRGPHRLGELDLCFLSSYSLGMYFAGHLADRTDLRRFLFLGMLGTGATTAAFGLAYWWGVHSLPFFFAVQLAGGAFQSVGWPCVVSVVGNWFEKGKRGAVMGIWSSNTYIGNIAGSVAAAAVLDYGWGWSFVIPAAFTIVVGFLVLGFLVVRPGDLKEVGSDGNGMEVEMSGSGGAVDDEVGEGDRLLSGKNTGSGGDANRVGEEDAIGFLEAWRLPGVAPYSFCLFFSKLVSYTFLYWLPFYLGNTAIAGQQLSHRHAGILSSVFDVGGIVGGVSAGYISDMTDTRAITVFLFLVFSVPALILYRILGGISHFLNIVFMLLAGYFVNGPLSLITTAVAADLGTQDQSKGSPRALATVTAIIDATGSVGAALGPLLTGYISTRGWDAVFIMLIISNSIACLFLIHLVKAEIVTKMNERK